MNEQLRRLILYIAGAFLFNVIFYREEMAVNTVIFDAFMLSSLYYLYPAAKTDSIVRWLFVMHILCLGTLLLHNTVLSKFAFIITLLLLTAFSEYKHRSAWYAGGSVMMNFILFVGSFAETLIDSMRGKKKRSAKWSKYLMLSIIPIILAFIFFVIYANANAVLADIAEKVGTWIEVNLQKLFSVFIWERIIFTLFGFYIIGSLLAKTRINYFSVNDINHSDELVRKRRIVRRPSKVIQQPVRRFSNTGLKNENTMGIISFTLLNMILLVVNCIDVDFVWLNFEFSADKPIYKLVHEGTELLIVSIVLAMSVVLFFFKGNLNFYKRNKWLKYGAYAWILQNGFLVLSVLLRDYYYIAHYGLAYKRIGVLFFLLMVLFGLITVFVKVSAKKTGYFLFRVNAWAAVVLLVSASFINWDVRIAKYNIAHRDKITLDTAFVLSLSDRTLPVIHQNKELFKDATLVNGDDMLQYRIGRYLKEQEQYSWLSWNYADGRTKKYLMEQNFKAPKE